MLAPRKAFLTGKAKWEEAREKAAVHYCQLCGWLPPVSEILYLVIFVGMVEVCSATSAALQWAVGIHEDVIMFVIWNTEIVHRLCCE